MKLITEYDFSIPFPSQMYIAKIRGEIKMELYEKSDQQILDLSCLCVFLAKEIEKVGGEMRIYTDQGMNYAYIELEGKRMEFGERLCEILCNMNADVSFGKGSFAKLWTVRVMI